MRKEISMMVLMALISAATYAQNIFTYGNLKYRITSPNTVAVSAEDTKMSGNVAIPEKIMQNDTIYTVTSVDKGGFEDCKGISSIVLPAKISKIGKRAFAGCYNLNTINIPYAVKEIMEGTFESCIYLTGITIPDGVTSIGDGAFQGCERLIRFIVPDECRYIGDQALSGCAKLQVITFPAKLEKIGQNVFQGCNEIVRFAVEEGNPSFESVNDMLIWKSKEQTSLIRYPSKKKEAMVEVPAYITEICEYAFENVEELVVVKTNASCRVIQNYAFFSCPKLQKVIYGQGLRRLGENAIFGCQMLKEDHIPAGVTFIEDE